MCSCQTFSINCCRNIGIGASSYSNGLDGAQVLFYNGTPPQTFGNENDVCYDTVTNKLYKKESGVWALKIDF